MYCRDFFMQHMQFRNIICVFTPRPERMCAGNMS